MFNGLKSGSYPAFLPTIPQDWPVRNHGLLAALCAAVFTILMPREENFPYKFQQGQPWSYRSLNAPFDFEVQYPEEQVRKELDRVNVEHAPYFRLDPELSRRQKKRFAQLVDEQVQISRHDTQFEDLVRNPAAYISFGSQLLDIIYSKGIVDPSEEAFKDTPGFIYLISGNMEKKVPVQDVGTINHARNFLTDTLPFSPLRQPELILPLLEKSLEVNVQYSDSLTAVYKRRKLAAVIGTGIMVHKGEPIIQPGEIVTGELLQKLQSLKGRYHVDHGPLSSLGTGLLALMAFIALLWSVFLFFPGDQRIFPLMTMSALLLSLSIGWLGRVGEAAPLLLPLWILPILFQKSAGKYKVGRLVWLTIVFLTMLNSNWASGWITIQLSGMISSLFFLERQTEWKARIIAGVGVWAVQLLSLTALAWSAQLPGTMHWTDGALFLLLSILLSFSLYPLRRLIF